MKRRDFIQKTAASASVFSIVPSHVLGFSGTAPNDKVQLGFIGVGKQGRGLMKNFVNYEGAAVMAVSDVDRLKMNLFSETFQESMKKEGKATYALDEISSYRDLLARKDIDAVVIASPDHWHAQMAVDAAKAGKDIYCEKPNAMSIAESILLAETIHRYGRVFQAGTQRRSIWGVLDWRFPFCHHSAIKLDV